MNHHIQHHTDVGPTKRVGRQAVHLDKARMREIAHGGVDGGIKALDMADLQNESLACGGSNERISLSECGRNRFFDQHVDVVFEQGTAKCPMEAGGNRETDRIHSPHELAVIRDRLAAERTSQNPNLGRVYITDCDDLDTRERGIDLGMSAAQMPHPNDSYTKRFDHPLSLAEGLVQRQPTWYNTPLMSTYLRLLRYLKPHLGIFGLAVLCMAVSSLLGGIQLGAIFPLADRIITNQLIPTPPWLPGWLVGVVTWLNAVKPLSMLTAFAIAIPILFFLRGLFEFWQTFYMTDVSQRVIKDLRQALFDRLTGLSLDYHKKSPTGTTMSRILYDTGTIQNSITEGGTDLVFQGLQVLVYLSIVLAINWRLALIIFVIVPLIAWPIGRVGSLLKKLSQQGQTVMGQFNSTILESISGIQVVQAFRVEQATRAKFAKANEQSYRITRKIQKRMNALSPLTELVGACGGAVVFWVGGRAVLANQVTLGTFLAFLLAMLSLIRPFKRLARLHGVNQQALAAAERIFEVLDTPSGIIEHTKARELPPFHREITYEHVSLHYDAQPALRNVSLTIPFGETLALVGPSGGGKTTLASLLPRFYDPNAGRVRIDGLDLKHVTLSSLRSQIGLVTQETFLFNDTVRANIALGKPEAEFTEIVEAARLANAHAFISNLPKGYDTPIGERGHLLSGGERQRLAIARAVLPQPRILIFDEATSQLDAQSEHLITESIERLREGRTVITIAHRLSTVRLAHRIVLLQEGRIVESGTHDELLQKSPLYRRFCELQLIHAEPESS